MLRAPSLAPAVLSCALACGGGPSTGSTGASGQGGSSSGSTGGGTRSTGSTSGGSFGTSTGTSGGAGDGGGGNDAGPASPTSWEGGLGPHLTLTAGAFTTQPLPVLSVLWSADEGTTWYANYQQCSGSSQYETDILLSAGELQLFPDYCTTSADAYDVRVATPTVMLMGSAPLANALSNAIFDAATPPLLSVFWSDDDGQSWYADAEICASSYGSSATNHSFQFGGGQLTLPSSYCTSSANAYQVVAAPAARTFVGTLSSSPTTLSDPVFSSSSPPLLSVFLSDDGTSWYSSYEYCAGGQSFAMGKGELVLNSTACTSGAAYYAVAAQP